MNKVDNKLRYRFEQALKEWGEHCGDDSVQIQSDITRYLDCKGYKKLKAMGTQILPLIREIYSPEYFKQRGIIKDRGLATVKELGLVCLVSDLCGEDFKVPENIQGRVTAMKQFTAGWLDFNMHKYF